MQHENSGVWVFGDVKKVSDREREREREREGERERESKGRERGREGERERERERERGGGEKEWGGRLCVCVCLCLQMCVCANVECIQCSSSKEIPSRRAIYDAVMACQPDPPPRSSTTVNLTSPAAAAVLA